MGFPIQYTASNLHINVFLGQHVMKQDNYWQPFRNISYTRKNAGLFQSKLGSNMDKPKCSVESESWKYIKWHF